MTHPSELLPCPFCGGEVTLIFGQASFDDAQIDCDCGTSGPNFDESPHRGIGAQNFNAAEAIAAWNTRHTAQSDLLAAAREVLRHRVGDLPHEGWLRDNDASRAALAKLTAAIDQTGGG